MIIHPPPLPKCHAWMDQSHYHIAVVVPLSISGTALAAQEFKSFESGSASFSVTVLRSD